MIVKKLDSAILEWIEKNEMVNSTNKKFEFDAHSFLLEPMSDWSRQIVVRKCGQVGFTESFGVCKSHFGARYYGWNVIYTNTTASASEDFVSTKVNPIIEKNPAMAADVSVSSLKIKQVKDNFIFYLGTYSNETKDDLASSDKGISKTADLNIYDERDRSNQFIIDQLSSRLDNSDYGGEWSFSNPTYPGVGVDGIWEKSDQKRWSVKCNHCGHWQYLDWVKVSEELGDQVLDHCLIDAENGLFVCGKCRKEITNTDRMRGEWIAVYPDREISGYWMSQMNYPKHQLLGEKGLLRKEQDRTPDNFYNFVLGKPYKSAELSVDRKIIYSNITSTKNDFKNVFFGVDQGVKKHIVGQDEVAIFTAEVTEDWGYVEQLFRKYDGRFYAVVDAMPYLQPALDLARKFPGRVFLAYYKEPKDKSNPIEWLKGKRRHEVFVNRSNMFDIIVDKFINGKMPINVPEKQLSEFAAHWSTMYRDNKEDRLGILRPVWESNNKDKDHFAHATLYSEVAKTKIVALGQSEVGGFAKQKGFEGQRSIEIDDNWTSALPSMDSIINNLGKGDEYV